MASSTIVLATILVAFACAANAQTPSFKLSNITGYVPVATSGNSTLYTATLSNPAYDWPVYLLDLKGSRWNMGFDYGVLFGEAMSQMYWKLLQNVVGDTFEDEFIETVIGPALDWQWEGWLSMQVPTEFLEELAGMQVGGVKVGIGNLDKIAARIITLANAPGDMQDFIYILLGEWNPAHQAKYAAIRESSGQQPEKVTGLQCSMFGVWGSRTADGSLYTCRNLDWNKDTGMAQYKLITVYSPDDGKYPHATCGFAGLGGALAGMSSQGLTVHEANLEENEITFNGFPWVLRLRYIMENAKNLAEAKALWLATNNTVGFNHMVGSAADAQSMVMETMHDYTAFFGSNDPREQSATYTKDNTTTQIGFPLPEAVYRTNHGYDPVIRQHYEWGQGPDTWSMQRYMMFHNGFQYYQDENIKIGDLEAVNITSIVGDKGQHAYQCEENTDGTNVLSVTFHPAKNQMYVAWEDGHNSTWRPASCNTYVLFDMTQWW